MFDKRKQILFRKSLVESLKHPIEGTKVDSNWDPMEFGTLTAYIIRQLWLANAERMFLTAQPACVEYVIGGQRHKMSIMSDVASVLRDYFLSSFDKQGLLECEIEKKIIIFKLSQIDDKEYQIEWNDTII